MPASSELAVRAEEFRAAHHQAEPLVLPNAWDVASARAVAAAGFAAIATSSRAVAAVLGEPDDDSSDPDLVFPFLARIAASVDRPVTADLQAGHSLAPAELIDRLLAAGIVGCNLEDSDHRGPGVLVEAERQAAFLAEVRAAAERAGVHVVLNARIDVFIRNVGEGRGQLDEAIRRGRLYLEAGADCVYPIRLADRARVGEFAAGVGGPVNVLVDPSDFDPAGLAGLGVRRISFGSSLHVAAMRHLEETLARLAVARRSAPDSPA